MKPNPGFCQMPFDMLCRQSLRRSLAACWVAIIACLAPSLYGQLLPPDAVDLAKVKIEEWVNASDLCPVARVAPNPSIAGFEHQGIRYQFSSESARNQFVHSPQDFVEAAKFARWERNFMTAMSPVWCPVTDQVNPGGFGEFDKLELKWRTCCQFCNPSFVPGCFDQALIRPRRNGLSAAAVLASTVLGRLRRRPAAQGASSTVTSVGSCSSQFQVPSSASGFRAQSFKSCLTRAGHGTFTSGEMSSV